MSSWTCQKCGKRYEVKVEGGRFVVPECCVSTTSASSPERRGERAERALYTALTEAGFGDVLEDLAEGDPVYLFVPQFAWAWYLRPMRGFSSDFAFPLAKVLVEIDGGAHAASREKVAEDTKRRGLAAAAGWILVAVTPDQVLEAGGRAAVELIRKAIDTRPRRGR